MSPPASLGGFDARRIPVRLGSASDRRTAGFAATVPLYDGPLVLLGSLLPGGRAATLRGALVSRVDEAGLDLARMAAAVEAVAADPGGSCRSAAVALLHGNTARLAATRGATIWLVRGARALGRTRREAVVNVRRGDRLVLACDGLAHRLPDPGELARAVASDDPGACALTLVSLGQLRGGHDLTAAIAEIGSEPGPAADPSIRALDGFLAGLEDALDLPDTP